MTPGGRALGILRAIVVTRTMRISSSNRFILLHLPRTGVSSVIAALDDAIFVRAAPTATNKLLSKWAWFIPRPLDQTYLRTHETAARVRRLLPPDVFATYRKIAFVRNPFSWLVSLYELVLQSPNHRHHARVATMAGFGEYVDWEIRRNKRRQLTYLTDKRGKILADDIGRFEYLSEDADKIFRSIGVAIGPLPKIGQFTRHDYREFYAAPTRRKVQAHWAPDLELFGYDFDGPTQRAAEYSGVSSKISPASQPPPSDS